MGSLKGKVCVGGYLDRADDTSNENDWYFQNLSTNHSLNFLNVLHNSTDTESFSAFFHDSNNDSPYDSPNFNCSYSSTVSLIALQSQRT